MATRKIVNKHINESSSTYVGQDGELFYDTVTNTLKISDGTTPGGTTLITDGGSAASITVVGDDSTGTTFNAGETIKIAGGTGITTAMSGDTLTITNTGGGGGAITFVGDDSTGTAVNAGETIKIAGTQNITTAVSGDTLTITGPNLSSYLTNSTITVVGDDSTGVTLNNGETLKIAGGTGITTAVSGDTLTITGSVSAQGITFVGDDSTGTRVSDGESFKIAGTQNITTAVSGDTLTITGPNLSSYLTSVPKTIDVNEISSSDSSAIQINDSVNISGTLNAKTLIANTISSEDSTAIQINDGLRISGDLTFSNNTVQTTAYVTASGNWTVTTGTNTYSFTVPSDGTYTMWVKGNIPNGIIIWNATVSVSNSNVAAIGYQYAWNYTGGGSPISFTAIPDQIKGSAGTISTDATYAGTTSNRFDFGIANSSGASQTVYYGYAKIS